MQLLSTQSISVLFSLISCPRASISSVTHVELHHFQHLSPHLHVVNIVQASNIVSVTNTFAGRAPVALAPDDSVLVCCNRSTAMDIQVFAFGCSINRQMFGGFRGFLFSLVVTMHR